MNGKADSAFDLQSLMQLAAQKHRSMLWKEAESIYYKILQSQPDLQALKVSLADGYDGFILSFGNTLYTLGKFNQGIQLYRQALELDPDFIGAHNDLGAIFITQGKLDAAAQCFETALKLNPNLAVIHNNLGNIFKGQNQLEAAIKSYRKAIELQPNWVDAYGNWANILLDLGEFEAAVEVYQQALSIKPGYDLAKFGLCMAQLPIIYTSLEEVEAKREQYEQHLQATAQFYQKASPTLQAEAATCVGHLQPFYLAYQGRSDRELQKIYGEMISRLMSSRYPQWSRSLPLPQLSSNDKIRVGVVTGFFYEHSCWKLIKGWIENLDRSEFELFGYYTTGIQKDKGTLQATKAFDKFTQGPLELEQWAEIISQDHLHVLIFPEFGMDPRTVPLGCLRLAPIQISSWIHPETSGLPTIDYFLTSDLMEPENGKEHYTEQLVRLPNLSIYYTPLDLEPETVSKQEIGLQDEEVMLWCCQSLYKYLPQYDDVFPRIARELEGCKFVFIQHHMGQKVTAVFQDRLNTAFAAFDLAYQDYCLFLPLMSVKRFAGVTAIADVFLDSIGWSGGNTTLESLPYNIPIVTFPGELMRGRHTMAILKMMGLEETIATTKEEYINIAVRLGRDPNHRQHISQQIAANKHKVYGDMEPVRALEDFLLQVVNKPRRFNALAVTETLQQATQQLRSQQFAVAQQLYQQILDHYPEHPEALYGLGIVAQQLGDLATAAQLLQQAATVQPDSAKLWFSLGNVQQALGQFPEATIAYQQAIALRPDAVALYNNLGYTLQQQGKFVEAASCYRQALDLQPTCLEAEANLGNVLHLQGQLSAEKIKYYADLNLRLGKAHHQAGDREAAITYYQQAIALQPNLEEPQHHLNLALQELKR